MITLPAGARILLATKPVDFRKGAHSLAALAAAELGADPFSGVVLVFRSKRADRVKISGVGRQRAWCWSGSSWRAARSAGRRLSDGVLRLTRGRVRGAVCRHRLATHTGGTGDSQTERACIESCRTMRAADDDTPTLPEDPAALRALLLEALAKVDTLSSRYVDISAERDALAEQNEHLRHLLAKLQRRQFGRKSEQLTDEQLQFAFEEIEATLAENAAEAGKQSPATAGPAEAAPPGRPRPPARASAADRAGTGAGGDGLPLLPGPAGRDRRSMPRSGST